MEQQEWKQKLVHNPRVPNWAGAHEGPSAQYFNKETNKEIDAFAGCGFLGFWVGTATGKGYERKMRGDERNMKGSNKNLKGKSRKMQADERIVRNFPQGEIK